MNSWWAMAGTWRTSKYVYFVYDREISSEYPHIHVAVKADNSSYKGKPVKGHSGYKGIFKVFLRPFDIFIYTMENVDIEVSNKKDKVLVDDIKKVVKWLNTENRKIGRKTYRETVLIIYTNFCKSIHRQWLEDVEGTAFE